MGAFDRLHDLEDVTFALFGGRSRHGGAAGDGLRAPHVELRQRDVLALAASGDYRAVVCGTAGRAALPAAWIGAPRAGVPFLLWASLWAHPRSAAHALSYPALRQIYSSADAVVTYGSHVSAYVREARGTQRARRPAGGRQRFLGGAGRSPRFQRNPAGMGSIGVQGVVYRSPSPGKGTLGD